MNSRRLFLTTAAIALAAPRVAFGENHSERGKALSFGTTPVFLDDRVALLQHWKSQLEEAMGHEVNFVQRGSYREISELLLKDQLDIAWVCGYPYVVNKPRFRLLAVPVYLGKPLYRSHLIVPRADQHTNRITELRGKVFAFSDPNSNSGFLVPRIELLRAGYSPETLFSKFFFTFAHRKVVEAVSVGLAHGGSVDGYIWDTLAKQQPEVTREARVAWRSPEYGFPPIVARSSLPNRVFLSVQKALTTMPGSVKGREILDQLNLDGFVARAESVFAGIDANAKLLERQTRRS